MTSPCIPPKCWHSRHCLGCQSTCTPENPAPTRSLAKCHMRYGTIVPSDKAQATKFNNISGCIVNIRSAKNDAAGRGHRYFFTKCNPATDKSTYCITWILWRYVQHARPGPRMQFFHIPELQWTLKPPYLNKRLQAMARMYDLHDESRPTRYALVALRQWQRPESASTKLNK